MKKGKLKLWTGLLSLVLLIWLILKLTHVPGGMILAGWLLGGIVIIAILIGSVILSAILKAIFKKVSFWAYYFMLTGICFLIFHYKLYSPTLRIMVPKGYSGEVTLVLSNVKKNILTIDTNGIGYLNEWTFNKTYARPMVLEADGKEINERSVAFNPSTFWALATSCCIDGKQYKSLSFTIAPEDKKNKKEFVSKDITQFIDRKLVRLLPPDEHTVIQIGTKKQ